MHNRSKREITIKGGGGKHKQKGRPRENGDEYVVSRAEIDIKDNEGEGDCNQTKLFGASSVITGFQAVALYKLEQG